MLEADWGSMGGPEWQTSRRGVVLLAVRSMHTMGQLQGQGVGSPSGGRRWATKLPHCG